MDLFEFADKSNEADVAKKKKAEAKPVAKPVVKPANNFENTPAEKSVLTVSQLSNQLRMLVEGRFASLSVEGEISGYKRAASGHIYFDLKDKDNLVKCIMWRSQAEKLKMPLADGQQVIIHGKLTTYGARSTYQITVSRVEASGIGALMQKFEALKAELMAEGLFDESRKQPLPFVPRKIGIITSPTGAVIEDMLHRIEDRFPSHVQLYPVLVQGVGAKEQIAEAITYFDRLTQEEKPDVLIVARGGGSLEDLWAFNEEIVIRAIASCHIPVISAVGHEPDVTLCDYVADFRAPTPTAAAERVVPVRADLVYTVSMQHSKLQRAMHHSLAMQKNKLQLFAKSLPDPASALQQMHLRLTDKQERLSLAAKGRLHILQQRLAAVRLRPELVQNILQQKQQKLAAAEKLLQSYSPKGPLKRGYVYMTDETGSVVRNQKTLAQGTALKAHFDDGVRQVIVGEEDA